MKEETTVRKKPLLPDVTERCGVRVLSAPGQCGWVGYRPGLGAGSVIEGAD